MDSQSAPSSYHFNLRIATLADIPTIQALIDLSVHTLHLCFYTSEAINLALQQVATVLPTHVNDGNYFVVEATALHGSSSLPNPIIVGCGGLSFRTKLYDNDPLPSQDLLLLNSSTEAARVRAMFVHPDWTRKGIASILIRACEAAAREAGFKTVELRSSLQAVLFYQKSGYQEIGKTEWQLGADEAMELVRMRKNLA